LRWFLVNWLIFKLIICLKEVFNMRTNKILGLSLIIIGVIILFAFYIPDGAILIPIGFVISICKMPEPLTSKEEWEKDKKK